MSLGEKRSSSIFDTCQKKEEKIVDEKELIAPKNHEKPIHEPSISHEKPIHEPPKNHQPKELATENRTHTLFFQTTEKQDYSIVLKSVQEHISTNHSELITSNDIEESKLQMKRYIGKFIFDKKLSVEGKTTDELIADIYTEMAEFGFLTKYVFGTGIEEIDINSWRDIEVQYSDGRTEKLDEHFESPEHAINVIRRMLHVSGIVLDNASPYALGHLSKNIRISVMKTPLVDEDVGISASIRIVNPQNMCKQDFIEGGTATEKMLDFLATCIRYGISICVAGATSSGKTTALGWLNSIVAKH